MRARELRDALAEFDGELEVAVRLTVASDDDVDLEVDDVIGAYGAVTDERSIMVEYGKLVILGDLELE